MRSIPAVFKDDRDKLAAVAVILCSMFFLFIPGLIVILGLRQYVSENTYEIAKSFFNFELLLFLISLFFMVPIIGWLAGIILAPFLAILNVILCIIGICAVAKGSEVKIPVWFEFV